MTGRNEAYYSNYHGTPQEIVSAIKWGVLYQRQHYNWQKQRRGTLTVGIARTAFINYIENHDQITNSAWGVRLDRLTSPGRIRAMTALMLLVPRPPMIFQVQEFASSSPFLYFADHRPELAAAVRRGRAEFLSQFGCMATADERCNLDLSERGSHAEVYALHSDLLGMRKTDSAFNNSRGGAIDGAVLGPEAFLIRFFNEQNGNRLLLVNLGPDLHLKSDPEPLLAAPEKRRWAIFWSNDNPRYRGSGTAAVATADDWNVPGHATMVLSPQSFDMGAETS